MSLVQDVAVTTTQRPLVRAAGLVKEFRRVKRITGRLGALRTFLGREHDVIRAVDDVSFDIAGGELVGYLGPNGAGKSTTIKMLTGILTPTAGTVSIAGHDPSRERKANALNIGVVFGQRSQLWWDLPLRESFRAVRDLYGVSPTGGRPEAGRARRTPRHGRVPRRAGSAAVPRSADAR